MLSSLLCLEKSWQFHLSREAQPYLKSNVQKLFIQSRFLFFFFNLCLVDCLLAQKLSSNLTSNENLKDMAANPLNTALHCLICEEQQGIFPENRTELYVDIIRCILRRSRNQRGLPETSKDLIQKVNKTPLKYLGSIALNGLLKDTLDFEQCELGSHADDFVSSFQPEGSDQRRPRRYSSHVSFHQRCAAFNLCCQLSQKKINPDSLFTGRYSQHLDEVLPFTCDLLAARCKETAITLIESITTQVNTREEDNKNTTDAQPSGTLSKALLKSRLMPKLTTLQIQRLNVALECIKECRVDLAPEFGSFLKLQTLPLQDQTISIANVIVLANSLKWNTTVTELTLVMVVLHLWLMRLQSTRP